MSQEMAAQEKLVAAGNTLVRLENDTQMAVSIQRPRDEMKILASALRELDLYPSMAEEAIYNKPVGKDDRGAKVYAEGLSIRTAESLANRWSNSAFGADIVSEDDDAATIAAVFLDYENNTRHVMQARVSKFYKSRDGKVVQYTPDRFDLVLKAAQSKLLREVILRSLPAGLKKEYENKARKLLKADKISSRRTAVCERFIELGITIEQLIAYQGKDLKDWKHDDLTDLLGLFNAIRDGEVTVESVFAKALNGKAKEEPGLKVQGHL